MPDLPLAGLRVMVTRPRDQAGGICRALNIAGAATFEFPVLEIVPRVAQLPRDVLAASTAVIFVSANAVQHGAPLIQASGALPKGVQVFAIGRATASALEAVGFKNVVSPQQNIDSEGLLALPQLQAVCGKHIILMRGYSEQGGRRELETVLSERGALVKVIECYERRAVIADRQRIVAAGRFLEDAPVPLVMALSVETLEALMASLGEFPGRLQDSWLLVPHPRVAQAAADLGFFFVLEVPMSAEALVPALVSLGPRIRARHH